MFSDFSFQFASLYLESMWPDHTRIKVAQISLKVARKVAAAILLIKLDFSK